LESKENKLIKEERWITTQRQEKGRKVEMAGLNLSCRKSKACAPTDVKFRHKTKVANQTRGWGGGIN